LSFFIIVSVVKAIRHNVGGFADCILVQYYLCVNHIAFVSAIISLDELIKESRLNFGWDGNRGDFSPRFYDFFSASQNFNPMGLGIAVNLDLFSVGIAIAGIGILGFMVFFSNRKSATNKAFFCLSWAIILWSLFNYLSYNLETSQRPLWFVRYVMFSAVWFAFFMYQLAYIFPKESIRFPSWYKAVLLPITFITSLLTLTPIVISGIVETAKTGQVAGIAVGPGIILFGLIAGGLDIVAITLFVNKALKATGTERKQLIFILIGVGITLSLLLIFNFIIPSIYNVLKFIPLGAVFVLPFVAFTAYAIFKHHLLDVKVIATEGAAFLLTIVSLFEVILSNDINVLLFRSAVFVLTLVFSIFLIRSVLNEVEQREQLQKLSEELKAANAQLEELSRFKTQLLSLASHQVKSPLAAMKGFVSLIIDGTYGEVNEKVKETLGKVKKSADELIGLINTLLDLRKAEEGKMDFKLAPADFVPLVAGVVDGLKSLVVEKKIEFTYVAPPEKIMVSADAPKLKQVIQNIIDNSIKYTPEGFVRVAVEKKDGNVVVSVKDSGFGISRDLLPHLFEEFVRDEKVKQKILGTGLGLYIARKIIEAHGGKIWAESEGEGKGAQFYVELKVV